MGTFLFRVSVLGSILWELALSKSNSSFCRFWGVVVDSSDRSGEPRFRFDDVRDLGTQMGVLEQSNHFRIMVCRNPLLLWVNEVVYSAMYARSVSTLVSCIMVTRWESVALHSIHRSFHRVVACFNRAI